MIQRIQSIFLFVVAVCMILSIFMPVWQKENKETKEKTELSFTSLDYQKENKDQKSTATFYLALMAGIVAGIAMYSIFRYDNRLLQMQLSLVNTLLMSGIIGISFYFISLGEKTFGEPKYGSFLIGFYLPMAGLIANVLANRFIRKDEKLVRSADRMR